MTSSIFYDTIAEKGSGLISSSIKDVLSASLIKLLSQKILDKITVSDICNDCGANRQTFYYHYRDKYDLVERTYESFFMSVFDEKELFPSWQKKYRTLLEKFLENKTVVLNTYNSKSREALDRALERQIFTIIFRIMQELSVGIQVDEDDKVLISRFFVFGIVGMTLEWISSGMQSTPQQLMYSLDRVINGGIKAALERCRTDRAKDEAPVRSEYFS